MPMAITITIAITINRAFPSLLGLERERHMDGVVLYLRQLGVQNVGRFVSRLPPVLGYDVKTNLAPKVTYLNPSLLMFQGTYIYGRVPGMFLRMSFALLVWYGMYDMAVTASATGTQQVTVGNLCCR